MAEIKLVIDKEKDLTTVTIVGSLQPGELTAILQDYFNHAPTRLIMMDSREGNWTSIPTAAYYRSIEDLRNLDFGRSDGRTALIFSDSADFGMGRLLESHLSIAGHHTEVECFRDIGKAEDWLFQTA